MYSKVLLPLYNSILIINNHDIITELNKQLNLVKTRRNLGIACSIFNCLICCICCAKSYINQTIKDDDSYQIFKNIFDNFNVYYGDDYKNNIAINNLFKSAMKIIADIIFKFKQHKEMSEIKKLMILDNYDKNPIDYPNFNLDLLKHNISYDTEDKCVFNIVKFIKNKITIPSIYNNNTIDFDIEILDTEKITLIAAFPLLCIVLLDNEQNCITGDIHAEIINKEYIKYKEIQ
jgi:hypothetical protein